MARVMGDASKVLIVGGDKENLFYFYTGGSSYKDNTIENIAAYAQEHFDSCRGKTVEEIESKHIFWGTESSSFHGLYNGDTYILFDDIEKLPKDVQQDALKRCPGYNGVLPSEESPKQIEYAAYDEMIACGRAYDPFTMYIENYQQEKAAERRNDELNKRFNELMQPVIEGYDRGVPYAIKNCRDVGEELTKWLGEKGIGVKVAPELPDFKGMMHELSTNVFRGEKTDCSLVSSNGHQLDFAGYPVESGYEFFVGGISVREDGRLLYRNDAQCFGPYDYRTYTEGRFKTKDEVVNYLTEKYIGQTFTEAKNFVPIVNEKFERNWDGKRLAGEYPNGDSYKAVIPKVHKNNIKDVDKKKVRVSFYVNAEDKRPAYAYVNKRDIHSFEADNSGEWVNNYRTIGLKNTTIDLYRRLEDGSSVKETWRVDDLQKAIEDTKAQYKAKLNNQNETEAEANAPSNDLEL